MQLRPAVVNAADAHRLTRRRLRGSPVIGSPRLNVVRCAGARDPTLCARRKVIKQRVGFLPDVAARHTARFLPSRLGRTRI